MKQETNGFSRRRFLENAAALGAVGALGFNQLFTSCTKQKTTKELDLPPLLDQAADGEPMKDHRSCIELPVSSRSGWASDSRFRPLP